MIECNIIGRGETPANAIEQHNRDASAHAALRDYVDGALLSKGTWMELARLTASGTYIVPNHVKKIGVLLIGGGAAGAATCESTRQSSTHKYSSIIGGGMAGDMAFAVLDVTPGQQIDCVIGAGGAPVKAAKASVSGNPGGTTIFGDIEAAGGVGASPIDEARPLLHDAYRICPDGKVNYFQPQISACCNAKTLRVGVDDTVVPTATEIKGFFGNSGVTVCRFTDGPITATDATGYGNGGGGAGCVNPDGPKTVTYYNGPATSGAGSPGLVIIYI